MFTLVPESKNDPSEIRAGVADSIMCMFRPDLEFFTSQEIVMSCMDFIYFNIEQKEIQSLILAVQKELSNLFSNDLKQYVSVEKNGFILTDLGKSVHKNPSSRSSVEKKIRSWANRSILENYGVEM